MQSFYKIGESSPVLSSGELHVWYISTQVTPGELMQYKSSLSENELLKVPFFEFDKDRDAYIVSQGALRKLLSAYLGIPDKLVKIGRQRKGKPYSIDNPGLFFNMSHSGKLVVIAFSCDGEVGIDIEKIRPLTDLDEMIFNNFTTSEIRFINAKPEERIKRFFRFWTIKESYLKAIGEGMRIPPENLEFAIEHDRINLLSVKGIFEQGDWNFEEFSISSNYVGTISFSQDNTSIKHLDFK